MAVITSFHATKCCHLVSKNEASAGAYAAERTRQFLIHSTLVLVFSLVATVLMRHLRSVRRQLGRDVTTKLISASVSDVARGKVRTPRATIRREGAAKMVVLTRHLESHDFGGMAKLQSAQGTDNRRFAAGLSPHLHVSTTATNDIASTLEPTFRRQQASYSTSSDVTSDHVTLLEELQTPAAGNILARSSSNPCLDFHRLFLFQSYNVCVVIFCSCAAPLQLRTPLRSK